MDFYKDFSYYSFDHFENAVNFGWEEVQNKNEGMFDKERLIYQLMGYYKYAVNRQRGGMYYKKVQLLNQELVLGYSEYRIVNSDTNQRVAVPDLILCDIMEGYCPPTEFIEFLETSLNPETEKYQTFFNNYDEEHFYGESIEYIQLIDRLEMAIAGNNVNELFGLLHQGVSIDIVTRNGSLLNSAIITGNEELSLKLIESGIGINNFNGIELLSGIENKQNRVVEVLLDNGIDMRLYNQKVNPLFHAVAFQNERAVEMLLKNHSELLQTYSNAFVRDCDILSWAKMAGNDDITQMIYENEHQ